MADYCIDDYEIDHKTCHFDGQLQLFKKVHTEKELNQMRGKTKNGDRSRKATGLCQRDNIAQ